VQWRVAASPAGCRREASSRELRYRPPLAARETDAWSAMQVGLHCRVYLVVSDDAGLDRLPEMLDAILTCGGAAADGLRLHVERR